MEGDNTLEVIVSSETAPKRGLLHRVYDRCRDYFSGEGFRKYMADSTSGVIFYTPLMGGCELATGMEPKDVLKMRLLGVASNMLGGRPYGMFLDYWRKLFRFKEDSSVTKKMVVDTGGMVVFYGIPYVAAMALFTHTSAERASLTTAVVATATVLSSGLFGRFLDWYRQKVWQVYKSPLENVVSGT